MHQSIALYPDIISTCNLTFDALVFFLESNLNTALLYLVVINSISRGAVIAGYQV